MKVSYNGNAPESLPVPGFAIGAIQTEPTQKDSPEPEEMQMLKIGDKENITPNTEKSNEQRFMQIVSEETHTEESKQQLLTPKKAVSDSMRSIDSSINVLHSYMKGQLQAFPDQQVRVMSPEAVNAACNCAAQITGLMRVKLSIAKFGYKIIQDRRRSGGKVESVHTQDE